MAIITNFYPPIVQDSLPAFLRKAACKIYFSLPIYNSINDIANVQISIVNQKTNISALSTTRYPTGIKIMSLAVDSSKTSDYKYYVKIQLSDLQDRSFEIGQFYKVQLRFTSTEASPVPDSGKIATWLYENKQYFSEWSKVCLIKGIEQPIITVRGFESSKQTTIFRNPIVNLIGNLSYANKQETEYLKSYRVLIRQANNLKEKLEDSDWIFIDSYTSNNEFNYQIKYNLLDGVEYVVTIQYTTNNLYLNHVSYHFMIVQNGIDKLDADIVATPDENNGRIKIDIISKNDQKFFGKVTIRRTSSQSNFHVWEDVKTFFSNKGAQLNYSWYDNTIKSGVWYKYCAQKRNSKGNRGIIIQTETPVMCVLNDIFLTTADRQLKLQFNPALNEFKFNVSESQQVTIGSKFPYIKRNGANFFRTFPIGGLISAFVDLTDWYDPHFYDNRFHYNENESKMFTSKEEIYGESLDLYQNYNNIHNITEYDDYIYEREFRNKVYDFLYKHDVKLFRSTTEGNILIKLMNIDFQPVVSLGRKLYAFTATAVEIDQPTLQNYYKYGILTSDQDQMEEISYVHNVLGQISGDFSSQNIISKLQKKYQNAASKNIAAKVNGLKWIRIEISSPPYIIIENAAGEPIRVTNSNTSLTGLNTVLGYIVKINGVDTIIYPTLQRRTKTLSNGKVTTEIVRTGVFELKEDDDLILIKKLQFKYPVTATIDYIAQISEEEEDRSHVATQFYYYTKPGQLFGTFNPQESLLRKIYNKYLLKYTKYYQKLLEITDVQMESVPGAVVYIKDSKDTDFNRHVLENGFLQLKDDSALIEGLYFCGIHLIECKNPLEFCTSNGIQPEDFVLQEGFYKDINEIKNPINGGIYCIQACGLKSGAFLENHRVLVVNKNSLEYTQATPDNFYVLLLDAIDDDDKVKFVYYYGCWYVLKDAIEKTKLLAGDIRQIRDNEYILTHEQYNTVQEITNPIPNGVYQILQAPTNNNLTFNKTLNATKNYIFAKTDENLIRNLSAESENQYIYYHGQWYPFTKNHDVFCAVDGSINYFCEIVKGVY